MNYSQAVQLLENGDIKNCIDFFKTNNYTLEYGYSLLLEGNFKEANAVLERCNSHRADWALKIIPLMQGIVQTLPTYFEIRSFLEVDLNLLFKAHQIKSVEYILGGADILQDINSETYKFIGRALLKNGYMNFSKIFFDKSLSSAYNDVELHYLFVEYYDANNDIQNALKAVKNCMRINPNYYPAIKYYKEHQSISS
jgi:tetratricopeptide (TPR) repeat protein